MKKIDRKAGDLTKVTDGIIVHQCNAQGTMGSGVAVCIKKKFPEAFDVYRQQYLHHRRNEQKVPMGSITFVKASDSLHVVNLIGQDKYRGLGGDYTEKRWTSYDALEDGIMNINQAWERGELGTVPMIHIPLIGSGLGGGKWDVVRTIFETNVSEELGITLWIK